jgi:hypothetical protein
MKARAFSHGHGTGTPEPQVMGTGPGRVSMNRRKSWGASGNSNAGT